MRAPEGSVELRPKGLEVLRKLNCLRRGLRRYHPLPVGDLHAFAALLDCTQHQLTTVYSISAPRFANTLHAFIDNLHVQRSQEDYVCISVQGLDVLLARRCSCRNVC